MYITDIQPKVNTKHSGNMKILKFAIALIMAAAPMAVYTPQAAAQTDQLDAGINIIPDRTVKTDEGVRITVCIVGIPNTSQRIDGVDLVMGPKIVKATDIDGVDFERYFQFEEDGVIVVETDFPFKGIIPKTAKLVFHTVKGDVTCPARN